MKTFLALSHGSHFYKSCLCLSVSGVLQLYLMWAVLWGNQEVTLLWTKVLGLEENFGGETLMGLLDTDGRERRGGVVSDMESSERVKNSMT